MSDVAKLKFKLEQVKAEIEATIGTVGGGIRLAVLRKKRDTLELELGDEEYAESERVRAELPAV